MKEIAFGAVLLPVTAFCVAGLIELKSKTSAAVKLARITFPVLGIVAFAFSLSPQTFTQAATSYPETFARVMTLLFALIGCSGSFVCYSRRISSVLVATGALMMAFFCAFLSLATT
ncbi:MAG TPA: hypothetical protein VMF91_07605 [Bryobacteraceae bacterium]|nr:hypothetical protein [Bryobacteraceae bacterium]